MTANQCPDVPAWLADLYDFATAMVLCECGRVFCVFGEREACPAREAEWHAEPRLNRPPK